MQYTLPSTIDYTHPSPALQYTQPSTIAYTHPSPALKYTQPMVKGSGVSLKLKLKLFHSKMYGIRSNLSDPTISSSQYDTLISVFQDYSKQDVLNIEF